MVNRDFSILVGKKIENVFLRYKQDLITFKTNHGNFSWLAVGDCCSQSWFEHVSGINSIIGQIVLKYESIDLPSSLKGDQHEYLQDYGYEFSTEKGKFILEMRNSSNGYYGGYLDESTSEETYPLKEDF